MTRRYVPIDAGAARQAASEPTAGSLFDPDPEPEPSGVEKAWENADDWWRSSALAGIKTLAATGREFDAYDVTELGVPEPDHPNRWGAIFNACHKRGLIKPVGYHQSRRPGRAGACRVWQGTGRT